MYYMVVVRNESKSGRAFICRSKAKLSVFTGIKESILVYQFERAKKRYYEHINPWVEIWVVDKIEKQNRTGRGLK